MAKLKFFKAGEKAIYDAETQWLDKLFKPCIECLTLNGYKDKKGDWQFTQADRMVWFFEREIIFMRGTQRVLTLTINDRNMPTFMSYAMFLGTAIHFNFFPNQVKKPVAI